jgi:hypothetical protein
MPFNKEGTNMGQLSNYTDFVLQLSKEAPHLYRASAIVGDSVAAAQTFELRTDELKVIEGLRRIEEQAVRAQAKETFHTEFGRDRYNKRHLGSALINIYQNLYNIDT